MDTVNYCCCTLISMMYVLCTYTHFWCYLCDIFYVMHTIALSPWAQWWNRLSQWSGDPGVLPFCVPRTDTGDPVCWHLVCVGKWLIWSLSMVLHVGCRHAYTSVQWEGFNCLILVISNIVCILNQSYFESNAHILKSAKIIV